MEDVLYQISFLIRTKTDEPLDWDWECRKIFEMIESDGRFEVLISGSEGLYRPTEQAKEGVQHGVHIQDLSNE